MRNGIGTFVSQSMEKVNVSNAFITSVFTQNNSFQESQARRPEPDWNNEDVCSVEKDYIRTYLSKLDMCKSIGNNLINAFKYPQGAHKDGSRAFSVCPVTGQDAVGIYWNTGSSLWTPGNFYCDSEQALAQVAQWGCGVLTLGAVQKLSG